MSYFMQVTCQMWCKISLVYSRKLLVHNRMLHVLLYTIIIIQNNPCQSCVEKLWEKIERGKCRNPLVMEKEWASHLPTSKSPLPSFHPWFQEWTRWNLSDGYTTIKDRLQTSTQWTHSHTQYHEEWWKCGLYAVL